MNYDFDAFIDRHGTDSLKFDRAVERHRSPDLLSLWVADMDFSTPPCVVEALCDRVRHGIFGYSEAGPRYYAALDDWCARRYGWHVPAEHVVVTPGVVYALAAAVRAYTKPGDAVVIQRPVYYPFTGVVEANGRRVANAPLVYEDGAYSIDFESFERTVVESNARLFLLCNPHNPGGRVWSAGELEELGRICARHDVVVASDEIHMDFARPGHEHASFALAGQDAGCRHIICTSASKTFNLAGLQVANVVVPDDELRRAYRGEMDAAGYSQPNVLGMVATQAAYEQGSDWLAELKDYLEGNWALTERMLAEKMPWARLVSSGSTYLAWIDCHSLGLSARELERFVEDEAGLWLDCGDMFGKEGEGFIRINIATQRAYLMKAYNQLADAARARGF